jgi:hypothetical protein
MSCVAREYSGLFTRWMQINDIVDMRGAAPDAEICPCDRMHGVFTRALTSLEHFILLYRLRGYVPGNDDPEFRSSRASITYRFKYGRLISWSDTDVFVYEIIKVVDALVSVMLSSSQDGRYTYVMANLQYGAWQTWDIPFVQLRYNGDTWQRLGRYQEEDPDIVLHENDMAAIRRLRTVDWPTTLATYMDRAEDRWIALVPVREHAAKSAEQSG